jgi:membrane associated rhomboid family serine protease
MIQETRTIIRSFFLPFLFVALIWIIWLGEMATQTDLGFLGVYPRRLQGLIGILTSPLIHADIKHLFANSVPLLVLGGCLFYFYRELAVKTFLLIYIVTGVCVWTGGREAYHIGASGVVYGLAAFLFFSGIIRRDGKLLAITLLVTFLYGSMVWGIFPDFFPERNISFESHFWGMAIGAVLAFYFRKIGPQRPKYEWEDEAETEEENKEEQIIPDEKPPSG